MIINFQEEAEKREPLIWRCNCGNCAFMLYEDGKVECSECNTFHHEIVEHYTVVRKWTRKKRGDN